MRHRTLTRLRVGTLLLLALVLLGGCTKEKALALKAAAEVFRDKAVGAIDNYEALMVEGALGPQQPESQQFQQVLSDLKGAAAGGKVTSKVATEALNGIDARERQTEFVRTNLADVRQAYVAYAASLARLPEGSFLAGDAVACAAGLGVRLTQRLAIFAEAAYQTPVRYQYRFGKAVADLNRALAAKNEDEVQRAVSELIEIRKAEKRDNALAITLFADAIGAGVRTVSLAHSYSDLSVADLLSGLNQILELRASTFGVDSTKAMERLSAYRTQMEEDPALKPILSIPLTESLPACKAR